MKEKNKILYVITQGTWGGAQRYVFDLTANLKDNFEIMVAIGKPNSQKNLQIKLTNHATIIQLKHLTRKISPIHDILAVFELAKLYKKIKPDIVHLNSSKAGILGSLARLFTKCPLTIVYTVHGWVFNEPVSKLKAHFYFLLERVTAKLKDKIIVLSPQDQLIATKRLKISPNRLVLIPLGIKPPVNPLSKEKAKKEILSYINKKILSDNIWFGTIANFYKTKGLDILIKSVAEIKNKTSNTHFFIIGDGPERKKLEKMIKENQLENIIHLTGNIKKAAEFLPAFDCFILPSRKEGLPYTILEAMNYGIPVIATKVGGIPSLIENKKTGLAVKPDQLAETILFALDNNKQMQKFGSTGVEQAKNFTLDKMIKQTKTLYLKEQIL